MSVRTLLVAISEEQQVAKEAQGVSPPGGSISFGQGHRTTEPRISLPSAVILHICYCNIPLVSNLV